MKTLTVARLTAARTAAEAAFQACYVCQCNISKAASSTTPFGVDDPVAWADGLADELKQLQARLESCLPRALLDLIELHCCSTLPPVETLGNSLPTAHESAFVVLDVVITQAWRVSGFYHDAEHLVPGSAARGRIKGFGVFDPQEHIARLAREWAMASNGAAEKADRNKKTKADSKGMQPEPETLRIIRMIQKGKKPDEIASECDTTADNARQVASRLRKGVYEIS